MNSLLDGEAYALALAFLTWKYVEQPFRTKRSRLVPSRSRVFAYAVSGNLVVAATGLYGYLNDGLPDRVAPSGASFAEIRIQERLETNYGLDRECGSLPLPGKCRTGDRPKVMLWGDSYGRHLANGLLASRSFQGHDLIQFTRTACTPVFGLSRTSLKYPETWSKACIEFNDHVKKRIAEDPDIEYVIISSRMGILFEETYDSKGVRHPVSEGLVLSALNETADFIRKAGKKPVLISPPPRTGDDLSRCPIHNLMFTDAESFDCTFVIDEISTEHIATTNFLLRKDLRLPILDLRDYLCDAERCSTYIDGINIFLDAGHMSRQGSHWIGARHDLLGAAMQKADQGLPHDVTS